MREISLSGFDINIKKTKKLTKYLKYLITKILQKRNRILAVKTEKKEIQELMTRLYPVITDKPLIRLGPKADGGYLLPNDFEEVDALFSAGIGETSEFERDIANFGIEVFLADKSVEGPACYHEKFKFTNKYIGASLNENFLALDDWVSSVRPVHTKDLILKMDIEGYEYETIISLSKNLLKRFRIIVVEFHNLHGIWNKSYFYFVNCAFRKILSTHTCVHIHPNNKAILSEREGLVIPSLLEISFLRNDRIINYEYQLSFPHELDYDNTSKQSIQLPNCWFRH